jgi:type II secretory pathway component GspD/PulD (secretin)
VRSPLHRSLGRILATAALLVAFAAAVAPQAVPSPQPQPAKAQAQAPTSSQRRRANRLYLSAGKLYLDGQFEPALKQYEEASNLDPANPDYTMAAGVARSHLVTSLVQSAARLRLTGDESGARADLERAMALDPENPVVAQHLNELGDDALRGLPEPLYKQSSSVAGAVEVLVPTPGTHDLHIQTNARQAIQQVFTLWGITVMLDDSVRTMPVKLDLDHADFTTATRLLALITNSFFVPMDAHRVLVARDTAVNRTQYTREAVETVRFNGLADAELTEISNLAKNVFNIQQVSPIPTQSALTLRADPALLEAFNTTMSSLLEGRNQVLLDVRLVQLAHNGARNTGAQLPQSFSAFNVYAEEQSILQANQSLVQQIISSGLASPNDPLAILGILLAAGQIPNSIFSGGVALFGGGLTESGLSPSGPATLNFSLNSSDSRLLDSIQLRLGDGEDATIKEGTRYPIQTSSYSSVSGSLPNIPGLTGAGSSSGLSSLLSSLSGSTPNIPMIQYQDIGLTLKVTPKVLRGNEVALKADFTLDGLSGVSINGNPIINHQAFSGSVTLKQGETTEIASEIDQSASRAVSGTPGLTDVPGLNNITYKNVQKNYATLLVIMTPHVIRLTQPAGRTAQMFVEKGTPAP